MKRQAKRWFWVGFGLFVAAPGGCGRADRSTGSQTNWLPCDEDADCASGECVNGACAPAPTAGKSGAGTGGSGAEAGANPGGASGAPNTGGTGGTSAAGAGGAMSGAGEGGQGGEPSMGPGPTRSRIAIGYQHGCLVNRGKLYCWGGNYYGELGASPYPSTFAPQEVAGLDDVAGVAVSDHHSCAFTQSGSVFCWGSNDVNQVGSDSAPAETCFLTPLMDVPCQPVPTLVPGVENVVELDVDAGVSCAVVSDGSVRCWGDTSDLEPWLSTLASVKSFSLGSAIDTGPLVACATLADGSLSCNFDLPPEVGTWGETRTLKLRNGSTWAATGFGCALGSDGGVSCFGDNGFGQLGNGAGVSAQALTGGVTELALGAQHACALLSDGKLECWGSNRLGAVGGYPLASPTCGSTTCEAAPRVVDGVPLLVAVGAGDYETCGLAADETMWCWGNGASAFGAPVRLVGPWEENGEACAELLEPVARSRYFPGRECLTDDDCIALPLDLPCDHTCDVAPVARMNAPYLETIMDELRSSVCPAAADAGCTSPELTCPERNVRVICATGSCTFDDPERTG